VLRNARGSRRSTTGDGGSRPRWRRSRGLFPSLPWPRSAGSAGRERTRWRRRAGAAQRAPPRRRAGAEVAYREFTEWAIDATAQLFDLGIDAGKLQPFDTANVDRARTLLNRAYLLDTLTGDRPQGREAVLRTLMTGGTRTLGVER
jgi:hypothetical protein